MNRNQRATRSPQIVLYLRINSHAIKHSNSVAMAAAYTETSTLVDCLPLMRASGFKWSLQKNCCTEKSALMNSSEQSAEYVDTAVVSVSLSVSPLGCDSTGAPASCCRHLTALLWHLQWCSRVVCERALVLYRPIMSLAVSSVCVFVCVGGQGTVRSTQALATFMLL